MQDQKHPSLRLRIADFIAGTGARRKDFVQSLSPLDGWSLNGTGRLNQYTTPPEQVAANLGWVFAANSAIADPCAAVQLTLFKKGKSGKDNRQQIFEHELLDLLDVPNLAHTGEQLRQLHYTYMNLAGESYILMLKAGKPFTPAKGQLPDALQILPTNRVVFKLGETYLKSIVKIDKQEFPVETMIRDLNPDPANPYYGRSVIAASAPIIDTENQMVEWNRRFFANNARPSLIFQSNEAMDDEVYRRWKQQFQDQHTGTENAFKPLLIEGGTATPYMLNQAELEFLASREFSMKQILSMFRVSPAMLGQVENVNRANLEAGFYQHAVVNTVPRVRQFVKQLNATLVSVYDPTLELDFENPVPEDVEAKLAAIKGGVGSWLTQDEGRAAYGMKPLPGGVGDHVVIVAGKNPATLEEIVNGEEPGDPSDENPEDPDGKDDDDPDQSPSKSAAALQVKKKTIPEPTPASEQVAQDTDRKARGDAKIALYTQRAEVYEQQMLTVLHQQFSMQRTEILQRAQAGQLRKSLKGLSKTKAQQQKRDWLAALLSWAAFDDTMRKALAPILFALIAETGKSAIQEVGMDPSQFNSVTAPILNYQQQRAQKIGVDVNDETEKQLRASMSQGIDNDESDNQLQARVELVMGAALTYRAARIAKTETTRAQGFADIQAWQQSGVVTGKVWEVGSNNPCAYCEQLDGVIVSLDQDFLSLGDTLTTADGQSMKINYDNIISPPVHPNCMCSIMPITIS